VVGEICPTYPIATSLKRFSIIIPDSVTSDGLTLVGIRATGRANQNTCRCAVQEPLPELPPEVSAPPSTIGGNFTVVGGYVEGVSFTSTSTIVSQISGVEVVYNFSTFQRIEYAYTGSGVQLPAFFAAAGAYYVGHVEGFLPNPVGRSANDYRQFEAQYSGTTFFNSAGIGAAPGIANFFTASLVAGINRFSSPSGLYGNQVYISAGLSFISPDFTIGLDGGAGRLNATPRPGRTSYIRNCQVDIGALLLDINIGTGSPAGIATIGSGPRLAASAAAAVAALDYNSKHSSCC
jgi:hypothetical protein